MPIQRNNLSYIVFINTDCLHQLTSSIVYNTEEDAKEAIKDYELSHKDSKYAIKLIRGEIIESIYKEI